MSGGGPQTTRQQEQPRLSGGNSKAVESSRGEKSDDCRCSCKQAGEEGSVRIGRKSACQVMKETFRYYEGSRILRELGYKGCGDRWRLRSRGPMTFNAAFRINSKAKLRLSQLYLEEIKKSMRRISERIAKKVNRLAESFRRLARSPGIRALVVQIEEVHESEAKKENWMEMAEDHERRALLGEVMIKIEEGREEAPCYPCELCQNPILPSYPMRFAFHNGVVRSLHADCYETLFEGLRDGVKGYVLSKSSGHPRGDHPSSVQKWEKLERTL